MERKNDLFVQQELYNITEAAGLLNMKISRLRTAVFRKEVTYVKLGGLVRFKKEDLKTWIEANTIRPIYDRPLLQN